MLGGRFLTPVRLFLGSELCAACAKRAAFKKSLCRECHQTLAKFIAMRKHDARANRITA